MELIRVLRILRHRWITVVAIVLGTVAIAVAAATYRNSTIRPVNRAEAPILFVSETGEPDSDNELSDIVAAEIDEALVRAVEVNSDYLADPVNEIIVDSTLGRLTFISRAEDPDEAVATATEMRRRFLTRQPVNMETQIEERLASLQEQMSAVRQAMVDLDTSMGVPREVAARRDRLNTLRSQLEDRALDLEQQILLPPGGEDAKPVSELQADLEEVEAAIATVNAELDELPATPGEFSTEMIERRALERQFRELEATYQELVLQRSEVSGSPQVGLVDVFDETPRPIPRRMAAPVALLLGLGLAMLVLLLSEKIRRPLWFPADLPRIPFLASVPSRQATPLPWYLQTGDNARKAAIQTLRSSIRARARGSDLVFGLASSGVDLDSMRMLGADLALGFASTRAGTALVDVSGGWGRDVPELENADLSLSDIVTEKFTNDEVTQHLDEALGNARSVHAHLVTVSGGAPQAVTSDAIAGPQVGHLFDTLRELMDVVVILTGDIASPATRAALDRTDMVLVAARPGKTTQGSLIALAEEMAVSEVDVLGVMVPKRLGHRLSETLDWLRARFTSERREAEALSEAGGLRAWFEALRARAGSRPQPGQPSEAPMEPPLEPAHTEVPVEAPAPAGPVVRMVTADTESDRLDEPAAMLETLRSTDPAEVAAMSEEFVVDWVTRLVEAKEGTDLHPDTVRAVNEAGFVPLSTWKNNPSVGSRLRFEWRTRLGRNDASRLETLLLKSLATRTDPGKVTSLDRWIHHHYFSLHARWTDWEPRVWNVSSAQGTLSALIAATRLDSERIERFVDGVIIRAIERLARRQRRQPQDDEQALELEQQIEDVRSLGLALAWLMDGSHEESRLWYPSVPRDEQPVGWQPDWAQGVKNNIAPLQRLGILAEPVLTEEELEVLDPTG